jgi:hypothetical protein
MTLRPEIEAFARRIANRHNRFLLRDCVLAAMAAASFAAMVAALSYVIRGHAVPVTVPGILIPLGMVAALTSYLVKRMDNHGAVMAADPFFGLKDGITTARHLVQHAPHEPATRLQWEWLAPRLHHCNPSAIQKPFPVKLGTLTFLLTLAATILCLLPPSPAIRAEQERAEATCQQVAEAKQELEELIDELEKDITSEEERKHIAMDELRQMVDKIQETGDRSEAARQFARIERKVREATRALDQQRDDETLKLTAEELRKSDDTDARKIGKKLEDKQLKQAAEEIDKVAAKKIDPAQLQKGAAEKKQTIEQAKKDLAKMRATTKRMAAAAKQRQAARQAQGQQADKNEQNQATQADQADSPQDLAEAQENANQPKPADAKPLEDMLAELDEAAAQLEKGLAEMEFDPDADWGEKGRKTEDKMKKAQAQLGQHLKNMQGKNQAKAKLGALRDALAQAQASAQGQGLQPGQNPGGLKPGTGSSWTERKEQDDSQKNGQLAELKGQHGEGPALSSVEDAESGSGTSSRRGTTQQRNFARQTESFVERNDIPESLKLGVRNYFENLQSTTKER